MGSGCRSKCPNCGLKCWRASHLKFGDQPHTHGNLQEIREDPNECNVGWWYRVKFGLEAVTIDQEEEL